MTSTNWDTRFMLLAHHIAQWSKERGKKVGSVIVGPDNVVVSTGFNGLPRGVNDDVEARHSRETGAKHMWSVHAEVNAICNAAKIGVALKGYRIYVPWFPCVNCAKTIIQSGISTLVAYEPDLQGSHWSADFKIVLEMFKESGVTIRFIEPLMELTTGEEPPVAPL